MQITEFYLGDAWREAIKEIVFKSKIVKDERGSKTLEENNILITVKSPLDSPLPKNFPMGPNAIDEYKDEIVSPNKNGFIYTYGNRIRDHFEGLDFLTCSVPYTRKFDQLESAIDRLYNCPESRRATCVTWDPVIDTQIDEVPCMIMIDFKIRDGKLNTTGVWRSHDMFGAYCANFFALREVAMYVARRLDVFVGDITTHSISAHIYEYDWESAKEVIKNDNSAN